MIFVITSIIEPLPGDRELTETQNLASLADH
jgi:hypothetical protein